VTEVRIGDHLAHQVTVVDENTVTAVVPSSQPAGSTGPRAVTLVTDSGESSLANGYTYVLLGSGSPPSISTPSSSSPVTKPATGGETVTITGANLTGATAVMIAGISSGFTVVSDTLITATAPAHAPGGMFDVAVTTPAGTYTAVGAIAYWQAPAWPCTVLEAAPDPAVVYDPALRTAILKTGRPWRITESALGIEMVLIPNGTFWMGCTISSSMTDCPNDETPNHWVTLTQPFFLGRYEVTQAQWTARMGNNPSNFTDASPQVPADQVPSRPVENMSWNAIVNDFQPGTGLRLPTEAEWEWACRAGTTQAYHGWAAMPQGFTDVSFVGNIAWSNTNSNSQTHPVGQLQPNGFGLYDMSGNVWEWCADAYDGNYYNHSPSVDPPGGTSGFLNNHRVVRGGSWYNVTGGARSSCRGSRAPEITGDDFGFRVARNAE
jgi:formylglycine-generating enzyme required for sulfatase activity